VIELIDLHKQFGDKKILRGVSLKVERGQSWAILGGSGTGKSVLLRHIVGLMKPNSGEVVVDGESLTSMNKKTLYRLREKFGFAFQEAALFDSMTVYENIAFPLRRQRRAIKEREVAHRVNECLEMVGMPGIAALMPSELSGGMRRRVGFARAVALKPTYLLFDEPTSGLDPVMTSILNDVIIRLRTELNATTITITHDMNSAKTIATHVALLVSGQVVAHATNRDFFLSTHPMVQQFVQGLADGPVTATLMK
jgi:phospholipid/cholesterol/gamma-HCH transport system ATP-binding protein